MSTASGGRLDRSSSSLDAVRLDLARVVSPQTAASVDPFGDGHSGSTYLVRFVDAPSAVLRLSPKGVRIAGPADVGRQGRIMAALGAAGLPVPRVIAYGSEPLVDGCAFVLSELVEGERWELVVGRSSPAHLAAMAVQVLAALHALPLSRSGIGGERVLSPEAELRHWAKLATWLPSDLAPDALELERRLRLDIPPPGVPALVHGDFHYGNLIFAGDRVAAVVDWEIAELGDPLLDLGSLAVASLRRRYAHEPNPTGGLELTLADLLSASGADPWRAAWHVALSCLKYSAIIGFNLWLHRDGKRHDPTYEQLGDTMAGLLGDGVLILSEGTNGL